MRLTSKKLFNPEGDDSIASRQLIGGNTTNLMNLNNIRYKWATNLSRKMLDNFWVPHTISLKTDALHFQSKLTDDEREAYEEILSFLVFLDSLQTNNVPKIAERITAPEVTECLTYHAAQEALHSRSYQYTIESVIPPERRERIYDMWRDKQYLFERNKYIASIFQKLIDEPTERNFILSLVANYVLEGLYFYNGFIFFYNLSSRGMMPETTSMIAYINRDELTHVVLFERMLNELLDNTYDSDIIQLVEAAVEQEIRWSQAVVGNKILGISTQSIEAYTKHLANDLLRKLNMKPIYPNVKNPYKHLESVMTGTVQNNFFESRGKDYEIGGFDFDGF